MKTHFNIKRRYSRRRKPSQKPNIPRYDRNSYIKADKVRVIDDEGENLGVMDTRTAINLAREKDLDLVEVSPNAKPPVARIVSWSKLKYELSKKAKGQSKKGSDVKEMWFNAFIDTGDLEHKLSRVREFLEKGDKVKIKVRYKRGADNDKLKQTMDEILEKAAEFAKTENPPKRDGRDLSVYLVKG